MTTMITTDQYVHLVESMYTHSTTRVVAEIQRALDLEPPCDYCGAEAHQSCVTKTGKATKTIHTERLIVARGLSKPPRRSRA